MRNVVGVLVAAALGIHCTARHLPAEDGGAPAETSDTSAPELVAAAPPSGGSGEAGRSERSTPAPVRDAPEPPSYADVLAPDFSALIRDDGSTHVTSTVVDGGGGATYVTGTFVGDVVIGKTLVKSRGDKDVFLLKIDAKGGVEWVRAIGSALAESAPRVTLEGTRVNVFGMTTGAMDCGAGPLPTWSSDTFFFCVFGGTDGTSISGGVFPTGTP